MGSQPVSSISPWCLLPSCFYVPALSSRPHFPPRCMVAWKDKLTQSFPPQVVLAQCFSTATESTQEQLVTVLLSRSFNKIMSLMIYLKSPLSASITRLQSRGIMRREWATAQGLAESWSDGLAGSRRPSPGDRRCHCALQMENKSACIAGNI